jgi:hypothetical protein
MGNAEHFNFDPYQVLQFIKWNIYFGYDRAVSEYIMSNVVGKMLKSGQFSPFVNFRPNYVKWQHFITICKYNSLQGHD